MKIINTIIFFLFLISYEIFFIFSSNTVNAYDTSVYVGAENSKEMYSYLVTFTVLALGLFVNLQYFKGQDKIFYLFLTYFIFVCASSFCTTFNMGIKATGTALVFSAVPAMTFMLFYLFSVNNWINYRTYFISILVVVILNIILFSKFYSFFTFMSDQRFHFQNFYVLFFLLPWLLLSKNKAFVFFVLVIFAFLAIISTRRAVVLSFFAMLPIYQMSIVFSSRKNVSGSFIIVTFVIIALICIVYKFMDLSFILERFSLIKEDGGSGRLDLYSYILSSIFNSNPLNCLFGHGAYFGVRDLTMKMEITGAHNDFLGTFYDLGIIGFFILVSICYLLWKRYVSLCRFSSPFAPAMGASLVFLLIISNVSAVFLGSFSSLYLFAFWGFVIGDMQSKLIYRNPNIYPRY